MRAALIAASLAILAACDDVVLPGQGPDGPIRTPETVGGNVVNTAEEATAVEAGDLPRPTEGLRFIGNWAANQQSCETAAWQFTETTLRVPTGSVCSFNRVTEVPGGYDVQATCTAEPPPTSDPLPTSDTLKLRFAESAKAMLFESESMANIGLVFCGRDV